MMQLIPIESDDSTDSRVVGGISKTRRSPCTCVPMRRDHEPDMPPESDCGQWTMIVTSRFKTEEPVVGVTLQRSEIVLDLFEKYYERVYVFARRSVPAAHAEDIAQDVFARLLGHRNLEKMTISMSYLLKIADNLIKRRYRRSQKFDQYVEETRRTGGNRDRERLRPPAATPDIRGKTEPLVAGLNRTELQVAMSRLTHHEHEAVRFIVCQGLSYEAAAKSLGVSVTTINNWKFRGLRKLKAFAERNTHGNKATFRQTG